MISSGVVISDGASKDISALATGSGRADVALTALQQEELSRDQIDLLRAIADGYEGETRASAPESKLSRTVAQAEQILATLEVGKDGFVKLTIPAGLSDIDAMKALNVYFREKLANMGRAAIWEGDLDWYAKQSTVSGRDTTQERNININPFVEGITSKTRANQESTLKEAGMTFAAPEEVALVLAAYACKNDGKDLLNDNWTRTAASGVALTANQYGGVNVFGPRDAYAYSLVGASGVRLSSN